ncbi:hypothetical protein AB4Z32_27895, partial [Massilia sp. 2TAF26]|uniref:hypothetical protein n=1 Tax=Massilia sp. 2TAF26 TaxID=3233012 RepID=UPI003F9AB73C
LVGIDQADAVWATSKGASGAHLCRKAAIPKNVELGDPPGQSGRLEASGLNLPRWVLAIWVWVVWARREAEAVVGRRRHDLEQQGLERLA